MQSTWLLAGSAVPCCDWLLCSIVHFWKRLETQESGFYQSVIESNSLIENKQCADLSQWRVHHHWHLSERRDWESCLSLTKINDGERSKDRSERGLKKKKKKWTYQLCSAFCSGKGGWVIHEQEDKKHKLTPLISNLVAISQWAVHHAVSHVSGLCLKGCYQRVPAGHPRLKKKMTSYGEVAKRSDCFDIWHFTMNFDSGTSWC